jgi:hypothetical protein
MDGLTTHRLSLEEQPRILRAAVTLSEHFDFQSLPIAGNVRVNIRTKGLIREDSCCCWLCKQAQGKDAI